MSDTTKAAMSIYVAIPEPTSSDPTYNEHSLPPYLAALRSSGATPIIIPLRERQEQVARLLARVQGVLLPGSRFDVDPQRYGEDPIPECGEPDPERTAVDELLLQDAFSLHKPVLAICQGIQTMNVWLNGTLIQALKTGIDHKPGREVLSAHPIRIAPGTRLAGMLPPGYAALPEVNSSHHQAIRVPGDGLRVSAVTAADGVIEAVELDSPNHFVVGVQWHPERTYTRSAFSRSIFAAFVQAATVWQPRRIEESVVRP
jgi:putative glutamine amidotransferase